MLDAQIGLYCVRVTFTKVFWYVTNNGTLLDARRHRSVIPSVFALSELLRQELSMTVITDDTWYDSHVSRSQCFRLVFRGDVRQYAEVERVLWSAVEPRLANLTSSSDHDDFNASVAVVFNEEYIIPSEYVFDITYLT